MVSFRSTAAVLACAATAVAHENGNWNYSLGLVLALVLRLVFFAFVSDLSCVVLTLVFARQGGILRK
jgi:hypothetical protein